MSDNEMTQSVSVRLAVVTSPGGAPKVLRLRRMSDGRVRATIAADGAWLTLTVTEGESVRAYPLTAESGKLTAILPRDLSAAAHFSLGSAPPKSDVAYAAAGDARLLPDIFPPSAGYDDNAVASVNYYAPSPDEQTDKDNVQPDEENTQPDKESAQPGEENIQPNEESEQTGEEGAMEPSEHINGNFSKDDFATCTHSAENATPHDRSNEQPTAQPNAQSNYNLSDPVQSPEDSAAKGHADFDPTSACTYSVENATPHDRSNEQPTAQPNAQHNYNLSDPVQSPEDSAAKGHTDIDASAICTHSVESAPPHNRSNAQPTAQPNYNLSDTVQSNGESAANARANPAAEDERSFPSRARSAQANAGAETERVRGRKLTYYERVGDRVESLMKEGERVPELEQMMPLSRWVRITYAPGKYYVVGVVGGRPDYICYGLPARYSAEPPEPLAGCCGWLPLDVRDPRGEGYWLLYQDADTGETITCEI